MEVEAMREKKDRGSTFIFRVPTELRELVEHQAKQNGQSLSNVLLYNSLDIAMDFEKNRHMTILADFADILIGRFETIGQDKESFTADEIKKIMLKTINVYNEQRLSRKLRIVRNYCKMAIDCYLNDHVEDYGGVDGFIINQCVVKIYDSLYQAGIINEKEHADKTAFYELYMSLEGNDLLTQKLS